MTPVLRWSLAGSALSWATLLAPPLVLLAWLLDSPAWPMPMLAVPLAPIVFGLVMRALRGDDARRRWWWMQSFGLGALLAPLVLASVPLHAFLTARTAGLLVLAGWFVLALLAHHSAVKVHEQVLDVSVTGLPRGVRVVQLSDVHIGSRKPAFLQGLVARVQALDPDVVVITGDLVDASDIADDALDSLATLGMPCLMCLGNHERYTRLPETLARIERAGVTVLRDARTRLHGVTLIGVDDRDRPDALPALLARLVDPEDVFTLLLYHRPDGWAAARAAGVHLTLAGHTHAGQIWPFGLAVKRAYPQMVGRFDAGGTTLYVSPGTGTWGPVLRLGTRSEMTLINLTPA